jgi:cell division protein FtsW
VNLSTAVRTGPFAVTNRYAARAEPVVVVTHGGDPWIVIAVMTLVALGVVMVFNTSFFFAGDRYGDPYHVLQKHLISIALGGLLCLLASRLNSRHYQALAYPLLAVVVVALLVVLMPGLGLVRGGARRWVGFGPLNFQPSELAKVATVLYLARSIVRKGTQMRSFTRGVLPHAIVVGAMATLVVIEPDFGTSVLLGVVLGTMLFVGGARWRDLLLPLAPVVVLGIYAVRSSPYRIRRVLTFLDPWQDPLDAGFQLVQSILAVGSGGLIGSGLGESKQKMFYLPEAHTDFIFSVVGEELGLVGALAFVGLFGVLAARGLRVALRHPTPFGQLAACGITVVLVLQAGVNMAVVLGLLPTKGLALPFVSYGGSAMLTSLTSVGILLALSREAG